jgi:hemerythrin-like domain-containing protein
MREHGVLRRVLIMYAEIIRRLEQQEPVPVDVLAAAAGIIRHFIEDYHEKLEEDFVFPRFEQAQQQVGLVNILRDQHKAGRCVTDAIQALATPAAVQGSAERQKLATALRAFGGMYAAHSAREDTVLFPPFRALVGEAEYDKLGDVFEDKEHALFGPKGFEGVVGEVAQLEAALGVNDLGQLTPSCSAFSSSP